MKTLARLSLPVLAAALSGCILVSGQILVEFELNNLIASTDSAVEAAQVDLNDISDYADHKEDLQGLADLAAVGKITNLGSQAIGVELWLTKDPTSFTTPGQVKAAGTRLWGPLNVAPGQTREVDWDASSALFTSQGKAALIGEVKGDGVFTVYYLGAAGTYNFSVKDGLLILVLDAKL